MVDFGGEGQGILLLHGLTGRAANWTATARWLSRHGRVVGYDARGHGHAKARGPYALSYVATLSRCRVARPGPRW